MLFQEGNMEIGVERVVEKFQRYAGEAPDGEDVARERLCQALCDECAAAVAELLRPGLEEIPEAAEALAAAEAFYQLALLDQAAGPEVVSSPELKMELGRRAEYAAMLREEKRRACRGFLREEGFYFGQA